MQVSELSSRAGAGMNVGTVGVIGGTSLLRFIRGSSCIMFVVFIDNKNCVQVYFSPSLVLD